MNRKYKSMFLVILLVVAYVLLFFAAIYIVLRINATHAAEKPTAADLSAYIEHFFHGIYPAREKAAKSYIPYILEASEKDHIDPFFVAETISKESSWNTKAIGPGGEIGLCQQMKRWAPGADLTTPKGQIVQCVKRIKEAFDICGHPLSAINQYCTGECNPIIGKAHFRYREYLKARGK